MLVEESESSGIAEDEHRDSPAHELSSSQISTEAQKVPFTGPPILPGGDLVLFQIEHHTLERNEKSERTLPRMSEGSELFS